jgi:MFS family permease
LLEVRFFRSVPFSGATVIAVSAFAALGGFLFLNTIYLQEVRGLSPLHAGMYTLPMAAMTVVFAPLSGRIVGSRGAQLPLVVAGCALTASSLLLTRLSATSSVGWLLMTYVVFGAGFGLVNAPITNTAVSGMPRAQAGVAAAIASTSRQVGQSLGVAVVGAVATAGIHGELRTSFATASHPGWWITAGCGAVVLLLGLATTTGWAKDTAARVAAGAAGGGGRPVGVPAPVG